MTETNNYLSKASYIGSVSLDLLKLPSNKLPWQPYETDDILATGLITVPNNYLLTMGSSVITSPNIDVMPSLATTPAFELPTNTQLYVAGREVIRWGGPQDPYEIDYDHYLFTPDFNLKIAHVSKAPKSIPHHLSEIPEKINDISEEWRGIFEWIRKGMK